MSEPIELGRMRHRITLQRVTSVAMPTSPAGVPPQDADETWGDVATYWAMIEPQRIRRTAGVDTPRNSVWSLVTIRNPGVPVTTADRFVLGARTLVIDGVQRDEELNEFLRIEVTENPAA